MYLLHFFGSIVVLTQKWGNFWNAPLLYSVSDMSLSLKSCLICVCYYPYLFVVHILTPYLTNFIRSSENIFRVPNASMAKSNLKHWLTPIIIATTLLFQTSRENRVKFRIYYFRLLFLSVVATGFIFIFFLFLPSSKWMSSWAQDITTVCNGQNTAKKEERGARWGTP